MKIQDLLEMQVHEPKLKLTHVDTFESNNGIIDGSLTIEDTDNGMKYRVDCLVNPANNTWQVSSIEVEDAQNHYEGDDTDFNTVNQFIKQNIKDIAHYYTLSEEEDEE
jgi:hypothetical protein